MSHYAKSEKRERDWTGLAMYCTVPYSTVRDCTVTRLEPIYTAVPGMQVFFRMKLEPSSSMLE